MFLSAGDADVAESAFFGDVVVGGFDAAFVREKAFFHADHVDVREFQSFGGMEGHHFDFGVVVLFFVFAGEIGSQGKFVDEVAECWLFRAGLVLADRFDEGVDDVLAHLDLFGGFELFLDEASVVGFVNQVHDEVGALGGVFLQAVAGVIQEVLELINWLASLVGKLGLDFGVFISVPEGAVFFDGMGHNLFECGFADAAGGCVDDAQESAIVFW